MEWYVNNGSGFWYPESHLCLSRHLIYDDEIRLDETFVITDNFYQVYRVWDTAFSIETLQSELMEAGFNDISIFSDVAGTPYEISSKTMGIVAK